jgi:hypothetical protein
MKTWQKLLVGAGLVAALAVPTGVAIAATDGGDHRGPESQQMMEGRGGHGRMGAMAGHGQAGPAGHEMQGGAHDAMHDSMGRNSPMR